MKTTIQSVNTVFDQKADIDIKAVNEVKKTKEEAETLITDLESNEKQIMSNISSLANLLSDASEDMYVERDQELTDDESVEHELSCLDKHVRSRFNRIKTEVISKMTAQKEKLEKVWKEEVDTIDLIGLKEVKYEFDQIDKSLTHLINDWDRRKHSELLSDHLYDLHHTWCNAYNDSFTEKAHIKRVEANTSINDDEV